MSTDRDTTRIVRSWLEEGRTTLPDWVRDDVLDRLPATPQRRSRGTAILKWLRRAHRRRRARLENHGGVRVEEEGVRRFSGVAQTYPRGVSFR